MTGMTNCDSTWGSLINRTYIVFMLIWRGLRCCREPCADCQQNSDAPKLFPDSLNWPLMHKLSKNICHAIGESWPVGRKNGLSKKNLKNGLFWRQKSASPIFAIHNLNPLNMRNYQVPPNIYHTYAKNWVNCYWVIRFWAILGHFWAREPGLYSKISDFQNLSVFINFSAWNNTACHRYI